MGFVTSSRSARPMVLAIGVAVAAGSQPAAAGAQSEPRDAPPFSATIDQINAELTTEMSGVSWRQGCPVPMSALRLISMPHHGFDGEVHRGEMVVHERVASDVVSAFARLYAAGFPIRRMERIEAYGGDDDASMAADNTSAFNCREITGGGAMSIHSWGQAIDVNPLENPYVRDGAVEPPAGAEFLDRHDVRPGMIVDGDVAVAAFGDIGFEWGGHWRSLKDYQHFEAAEVSGSESQDPGGALLPTRAESCSQAAPSSDAWTGDVTRLVDVDTGQIDVGPFNEYLAGASPVAVSPCDAARVLLHLDRPGGDGEATVVVVEPDGPSTTSVAVTLDGLLDDSISAVRYVLRFDRAADGSIRLAAGDWSQRCQPGRGHEEFTAELCV